MNLLKHSSSLSDIMKKIKRISQDVHQSYTRTNIMEIKAVKTLAENEKQLLYRPGLNGRSHDSMNSNLCCKVFMDGAVYE